MANFLSNALGSDGIAKMAGEKVGDLVEETVKNVMGGNKEKEGEKKEEGEKKQEEKGGFGLGDALSLVGGNKEKEGGDGGGGVDVNKVLGGLFK